MKTRTCGKSLVKIAHVYLFSFLVFGQHCLQETLCQSSLSEFLSMKCLRTSEWRIKLNGLNETF